MGNSIKKPKKEKKSKNDKKLKKSKKSKKTEQTDEIDFSKQPNNLTHQTPEISSQTPKSITKGESENEDDYIEYYNESNKRVTADDFELLKVIGRGSFGKVMLVKKKDTKKIYAMKILKKTVVKERKQVDHTKAEKNVLMQLHHPFIIKLYYAFQTADKLYMVMDFYNGGELFHHLKNENCFSEERAKFYAAEISLVLLHIHSLGIIYRDLKPENILLDSEGHIVITDFGLSKQLADDEQTSTFCGTPDYLAPEILKGKGHSREVDWWALGILIYEMVVGIPPFYDDDTSLMYQKIMKSQPQFPRNMSYECKSIIMGLLEKDPEERLGGEDVLTMGWFNDIDFNKLKKRELTPPWVPPVRNHLELSQIDEEFMMEDAVDTPPLEDGMNQDQTFEGFTFVQTQDVMNEDV